MNMQGGKVLDAIVTEFEKIGYKCKTDLVNAADYGVPQARPRFVLIGVRGFDKKITFPKPTHGKTDESGQMQLFTSKLLPYVTVENAFSNLPVVDQGEGEEEMQMEARWDNDFQKNCIGERNPGILYNHRATKHSKAVQDRYAMIPQGCNNSVLPAEIRTKKQNAYKLDLSLPGRTVTCNFRTDLIHPIMNRGLTVREAARLQSFDKVQEISGAILPLVETHAKNIPFYAAVLAGEFTENALDQLESQGFLCCISIMQRSVVCSKPLDCQFIGRKIQVNLSFRIL